MLLALWGSDVGSGAGPAAKPLQYVDFLLLRDSGHHDSESVSINSFAFPEAFHLSECCKFSKSLKEKHYLLCLQKAWKDMELTWEHSVCNSVISSLRHSEYRFTNAFDLKD